MQDTADEDARQGARQTSRDGPASNRLTWR
jgi:hypothetical protein